jgi:hypothetical protein
LNEYLARVSCGLLVSVPTTRRARKEHARRLLSETDVGHLMLAAKAKADFAANETAHFVRYGVAALGSSMSHHTLSQGSEKRCAVNRLRIGAT